MTVAELLKDIAEKFPRFPLDGWAKEYRQALSGLEGNRLRKAWSSVLLDWTDQGAPKPAHILKAANSTGVKEDADGLTPFMRSLKEKDSRRLERAKEIRGALLAKYRPLIDGEAEHGGWGHLLFVHLAYVAHEVAKAEIDFGKSRDDAIRFMNWRRRPYDAKNLHDPDKVFSEADVTAWKHMGPQQRRAAPTRRARSRDTGRPTLFGAIPNPNTKGRQLTPTQILESLTPEQRREHERAWEKRANFVEPQIDPIAECVEAA